MMPVSEPVAKMACVVRDSGAGYPVFGV